MTVERQEIDVNEARLSADVQLPAAVTCLSLISMTFDRQEIEVIEARSSADVQILAAVSVF